MPKNLKTININLFLMTSISRKAQHTTCPTYNNT